MDDKKIIYSMSGVGKVYPGRKQVLKDISLSYFYGAKIGVLGYNGSGKSSLLNIMAGIDDDFLGNAVLSKGYKVGYLEQDPKLDKDKTVKEIVEEGAKETVQLLKDFDDINAKFAEPMSDDEMTELLAKQAKVQDKLDAAEAWDLDSKLELAMDALRCPPADQKIEHLSGGERRRVALCRLLIEEPDILLVDEPTNHLDAETVFWLEKHLHNYKGTVIAVTHDRYFLDNVAGWILELDRGQGIPWRGNYSSWLEQKGKRLKTEEKQESKRQRALSSELEWIRQSPKARQAKSKARVARFDELLKKSKDKSFETTELFIPPGPRLGDNVLEVSGVSKSFGDKLLYENLNFKIPPGAIVGIIGPNGAGKTTLFRMVMGEEQPDAGTFKVGDTVKFSYADQSRGMDPNKTLLENIAGDRDMITVGGKEINTRAYLSKFNFSGDDQKKKYTELSGGEKNRVHLAKTLLSEGNVLLLDEPTNDLDINTLRALEDALLNFPGSAVIISHDRYFLDRVATHILGFEGNSEVYLFEGNFSDYEEDKKKRLGIDSIVPKRIQYKRLKR
ncbi:MAG: energy-dependent translational throttle protein EttA [Bacteriovoracaceae bacterium]|jgi:energy-dependent translational throttle protein EttA|nr:energy-dependent translational throttle protein EttA [Bacteriovoracaceae bacterium]